MEDKITSMAAEPAGTYPMTSYADVMEYLHRIRISTSDKARVGRRLVEEASGGYLTEAFERIDHLSQLRDGWDGNDALRISNYVLQNIHEVLLLSNDEDWHHWTISPDVNGTLMMQSDRNTASLSLGELEYSYLFRKDDFREGRSHLPFDADEFLNVMRRIG